MYPRLIPGLLLLLWAAPLRAQRSTAELRLQVADAAGLPLEARVELSSQSTQLRLSATTDRAGRWIAKGLPFGPYRLSVERAGFAPYASLLELRSEAPADYRATLNVAGVETTLVVTDSETLLDPGNAGAAQYIGAETLRDRRSSDPSRAVLDQVQTQPGWLLEANGVLHPRGAEYGTQYVIDGIPIQDNRSPGFAPALEIEDLDSMKVFTANYPAEYGRKLGGVVEVASPAQSQPGAHGKLQLQTGSFGAVHGYASGQYAPGRTTVSAGVESGRTDRFLDPPVEQNYTNSGTTAGAHARVERDFSDADRLRVSLYSRRARFLVPNELDQQARGQRQDRTGAETMGQIAWQHVFSPRAVASVRGMARDLTVRLWSNVLSTPIEAEQDRGFREGYASGSVSYHRGAHEWKAGVETIQAGLRERFGYRITDPAHFDDDLPGRFDFRERATSSEQAAFVQDLIRAGPWTFSAGLRFDRYSLVVRDRAFSPRLGVAWHWPSASMVFRASYDRAFQTPATENLLLASSSVAQRLTEETTGLPVPTSRGNFYQAGFSKGVFGKLRLDGNYFRRNIGNFADDDVLLNTGVSFPVAFSHATIHGFEAKIEVPRWGPFSGYLSYANLSGKGRLPVTGGLFLEEEARELLRSTSEFPISQDQRNTVSGRVRGQIGPRAFVAFGGWYGSGLPIEREGGEEDEADLEAAYGRRILDRVSFACGRVRPSLSFDVSGAVDVWKRERRILRLHGDVLNLTNRLNAINFSGLFSGTAIAAPRALTLRLQAEF